MGNPVHVSVQVLTADAMEFPTDLLVLKHAQALHGLDRVVVRRLAGRAPTTLPAVGDHLVVSGGPTVAATNLLFLGVPALTDFDYRDVRLFGERALSVPAAERMRAADICLTLHGVGFGLDETEAFRSEVAGLLDAIEAGHVEDELRTITFLESDSRRADRLTGLLDELWPGVTSRHPVDRGSRRTAGSALRDVGLESGQRTHAFVAMPFSEEYEDRFYFGIAPQVHQAGMLCERMDQTVFTGDIVEMMKRRIASASVVVADLSAANPNVYLEVGFAWASGVPTILLCDGATEPQFDVRGHRHLRYHSIRDLERKLAHELVGLLGPTGPPAAVADR